MSETMEKSIAVVTIIYLSICSVLSARTITVDDDAPADFTTIQAAIDDAANGDEIVVSPGTYTGPGNRDIDFKDKAITVQSTDPNDPNIVETTIVDCQQQGRGFRLSMGVLSGLTIINGSTDTYGAGIYCEKNAVVDRCVVAGNTAEIRGGGVYCRRGNPLIYNCAVYGNSAYRGGGIYLYGGKIQNCTITDNSATYGGGVHTGGIQTVARCLISRNSAIQGAGIFLTGGDGTVRNCVISDNVFAEGSRQNGGGIYSGDVYGMAVANCVIYDNRCPKDGLAGGLYASSEGLRVVNCIFGGDQGMEIDGEFAPGSVQYTIYDWTDPAFVDPANGDFHLKPDSPCIDAGDPDYQPYAGETDYYGNARISGGRIDIGVAEYPSTLSIPVIVLSPTEFEFFVNEGSGLHSMPLQISNAGDGELHWYVADAPAWLGLDPDSGSSAGEIMDVNIVVDTAGLAWGNYNGSLLVVDRRASNSPVTISASLRVDGPTIYLHPYMTYFEYEGASQSSSQILNVENIRGGTLNWQATCDCEWLKVTPTQGQVGAGETEQVSLSVDVNNLPDTDLKCKLTVSDPNAQNQSKSVYVTFIRPELALSTDSIERTASEGSVDPMEYRLRVSNSAAGLLVWEAMYDCPWLSIDPGVGSVAAGDVNEVIVALDPTGLEQGVYDCQLVVDAYLATNAPQALPIKLTITEGVSGPIQVPQDLPTIQAAVDVADPGHVIVLAPGTYTGPGNRDVDFKGKAITIRSTDPNDPNVVEATVIDCQQLGRGFYLEGCPGATIEGLTITNGLADQGGGIYIEDSNATIENCRIMQDRTLAGDDSDPNGGGGGGVYLLHSDVMASGCTISYNQTGAGGRFGRGGDGGHGGGICCMGSLLTLKDCEIVHNSAGSGASGGECDAGPGGSGGGIYADSPSRLILSDSTISANESGQGGHDTACGNKGGSGGGIYCVSIEPLQLSECTISENSAGKPGWSYCAEVAGDGGGIYCRNAVIEACTVSRNWAKEGEPGGNVCGYGRGGHGGGIYCTESIELIDAVITSNRAGSGMTAVQGWAGPGKGGGIYCVGSVYLRESVVTQNSAGNNGGDGGGIWCNTLTMAGSVVSGNSAGEGAAFYGGSGGEGGGIYCSRAQIDNSTIAGNTAGSGGYGNPADSTGEGGDGGDAGGVYCDTATLSNCLIVGNSGGQGGRGAWIMTGGKGGDGAGLYCKDATVSNCTLAANVAGSGGTSDEGERGPDGKGAGLHCTGQTTILDSIFWDNSPDGMFGHDCSNVSFSNIQDANCAGANGNISADPLFTTAFAADFYLSQIAAGQAANSPCVDAGSDTAANLGLDIYTTRTDKLWDQGIVDMGYHYTQTVADLNDDGTVDTKDLAILASQWNQTPGTPSADVIPLTTGDGQVDIHDLALLADWWLWPWP